MRVEDIRRILVVGAGTMGQQISLQCALHGYDVTLYDIDPKMLDKAHAQHQAILAGFAERGHLAPEQVGQTLARITLTTDANIAAADADLLSESVPEDPDLKARVFAQFNLLCPADTIFTTNTSSLIPSMLAGATGRPARFAAFHFHQPTWISNVVDVMPHPGTAPEITEVLRAFARRIGQIPIVYQRESPAYIFNAILGAMNREALNLVMNGVASVSDVDRAWMGVMKMPIGPFGIMDAVGLDTLWTITDYWARMLNDPQGRRQADYLKTYIDQERLGVKSGHGFYSYPAPAYRRPNFLTDDRAGSDTQE
jgi:3-hydroxybutyryl-CoA dehydrogenase